MKNGIRVWMEKKLVWGMVGVAFASVGLIYAGEAATERPERERVVEKARETQKEPQGRLERSEKVEREVFLRKER